MLFLQLELLLFQVDLLLSLFRPKVCSVRSLFQYLLKLFLVPILLDLHSQSIHVGDIILLLEHKIMLSDDVLLLFLPSELFSFEISDVFHFFAFLFESFVCLIIDFLQVLNVLLALSLSVIINLKWSLRSHEIWISIMVKRPRDLFSTEC